MASGLEDYSQMHLVAEAGPQGFSAVVLDDVNKVFTDAICYAGIKPGDYEAVLNTVNMFNQKFKKTDIIWNFPESIITPPEYFKRETNGQMLDMVFGDKVNMEHQSEFMYQFNLHNVYRIPVQLYKLFKNKFPAAHFSHEYSVLAASRNEKGNLAYAVFYNGHFSLLLLKDRKLQLVSNLPFHTPEDAAWQLLNACSQNGIEAGKVQLLLSGMIEMESALYKELYKYFTEIKMDGLPAGFNCRDCFGKHPVHFFSYLFHQAACV